MFVSLSFIVIFIATVLIFFIIKKSLRVPFLTLASLFYCFHLDFYAGSVLLLVSIINYIAGHRLYAAMQAERRRESAFLIKAVPVLNIGILFGYKFLTGFFEITGLSHKIPENTLRYFVIPIGLSFYIFQAISYLADIYREKYKPEENIFEFVLYMCFFPKFVSGPIERGEDFIKQLKEIRQVKFWHRGRLSEAFSFILYGYFMKVVIADRLVITVSKLFEAPQSYSSFWLILGIAFYTVQIYADFAGYSYIAVGCAKVFGIQLNLNFQNPYFSSSIGEFWRRWHISLSSWLRDYVYISLGGNRKGRLRKNLNTILVFIICGIWHGTGMTFLVWGLLHGFYSVMEQLVLHKINIRWLRKVIVLVEVAVAWVFFNAASLENAIGYLYHSFIPGMNGPAIGEGYAALGLNAVELYVILISVAMLFFFDYCGKRREKVFPEWLQEKGNAVRYVIFYILLMGIIVFGIYGPGYDASHFIYMQF